MRRRSAPAWVLFAASFVACGGRVGGAEGQSEAGPPAPCATPDCSPSPPERPPPSDDAGTPDEPDVTPAEPPEADIPDTAPPPQETRPEGPCPPADGVLAGMLCQAGPQVCAGNPAPCDGRIFYDALVCSKDADSGAWLWESVATTTCGGADASE